MIEARLRLRSPCRMLVFGALDDAEQLANLNLGGLTCFVDDDAEKVGAFVSDAGALAYEVSYDGRLANWQNVLQQYSSGENPFRLVLPKEVEANLWDVILVDAPAGYTWSSPGRVESIHAACRLARLSVRTDVFIHDCQRPVEAIVSGFFFGRDCLIAQVGSLRHYRI